MSASQPLVPLPIRYMRTKMRFIEKEVEKIDSKEQLKQLISRYQNLIFSICLKMTGDYFTAEDLTQETFLAAFRHLEEFNGQDEKAWLCRIASNKCIDYHRQAARRMIPTPEEDLPVGADEKQEPLRLFLNQEVMEEFMSCLKALPPPYREVAQRHYVEGMTAREIADSMAANVKTIQTQIYRAREMLKKNLCRLERR